MGLSNAKPEAKPSGADFPGLIRKPPPCTVSFMNDPKLPRDAVDSGGSFEGLPGPVGIDPDSDISEAARGSRAVIAAERHALSEDFAWVLTDPTRRAAMEESWQQFLSGDLVRPESGARASTRVVGELARTLIEGETTSRRRR